jgi:ABC-type lipoprotein export system ATPase subunit
MLKVDNLNKTFHTAAGDVHAVRDVSFNADNGEMVAIIGASGSGKSTLLALLGLLDAPDKGSVVRRVFREVNSNASPSRAHSRLSRS